MKPVFIYALNCPITGRARYVGVTTRPSKRLREHILESARESNHRACWIRSLSSQGLLPTIEFLAQVNPNTWEQDERDYIAAFRSMGCDLVNCSDGGAGLLSPPAEVVAKISASKLGKPPWNKGKKCPQLSAALSGEKNHRFGKAPWNKGKTCPGMPGEKNPMFGKVPWNKGKPGPKKSPETIAKTAAKNTGKKRTPEQREAIRNGLVAHFKNKKYG